MFKVDSGKQMSQFIEKLREEDAKEEKKKKNIKKTRFTVRVMMNITCVHHVVSSR